MVDSDVQSIAQSLGHLTPSQLGWVQGVIKQFQLPHTFQRNLTSDVINDVVLEALGDTLRIHHAFSRQALSKDRFEFAFERALLQGGHRAALASSRTNRGHDLTVNDVPVSLKTEAAANIKLDSLHISKFMELGRGEWILAALRDLFLEHMRGYDRIFQFRCLGSGPVNYKYELVEIPMDLFREASNAELQTQEGSRQTPKPGYGYVRDVSGNLKFSLYFDGGTERKLQIKGIRKDLCVVHATWEFESAPLE